MAIRADSYSSIDDVTAYTRHLLDGAGTFGPDSRPPLRDVESFVDRASATLNGALAGVGLAVPITNSTAKLICSDWVTTRAAMYVELTQRGTGYSESEGSRIGAFKAMYADANKFAAEYFLPFVRLGVSVAHQMSEGLAFTGLDAQSQRSDPDDSTVEQPLFTRALFDFDNRLLADDDEDDR